MKPRKPIIKSRRAERFVASLLALTSFGSYNKRVCGSLRSPKPFATLRASHTRIPLSEMPAVALEERFKISDEFHL